MKIMMVFVLFVFFIWASHAITHASVIFFY